MEVSTRSSSSSCCRMHGDHEELPWEEQEEVKSPILRHKNKKYGRPWMNDKFGTDRVVENKPKPGWSARA